MDWIDYLFVLPYSMLFIFCVNVCAVLFGSSIFRLIVDVESLEAQELEVRSYNRSLREAKRKNDREALRRLKRREARIKSMSTSVSRKRLKAVMITVLPFMTLSFLLGILYRGGETALFPFEFVLLNRDTSFSIWYLLTYFTAYLPLSRIFKSSPSLWQDSEVEAG